MSANIAMTKDGNYMMVSANKSPWHKLGVVLPDTFTSKQALEYSGLSFQVTKQRLVTEHGHLDSGKYATVRMDTQKILGIVSPKYEVVQNTECFEFLDGLVEEGGLTYETVGAIGNGECVWMLANLDSHIVLPGNDVIKKYLLLVTSHDGSKTLSVMPTPIRVVCQNTLHAALANSNHLVKLKHQCNIKYNLQMAREILQESFAYYNDVEQAASVLASDNLNQLQFEQYVSAIMNTKPGSNVMSRIYDLFARENKQTAWSAYNAIIEYIDHYRTPDVRLLGTMLDSPTLGLKTKAWDYWAVSV